MSANPLAKKTRKEVNALEDERNWEYGRQRAIGCAWAALHLWKLVLEVLCHTRNGFTLLPRLSASQSALVRSFYVYVALLTSTNTIVKEKS